MKRSIKEPIPEILESWAVLNEAVDAHLGRNTQRAEVCFKKADMRAVWEWLNPAWVRADLNVVFRSPSDDTRQLPKEIRDPDRNIAPAIRSAVLQRDGYRCRYCGIPVVHSDIRKLAHRLYPNAVPWDQLDPAKQHAGFACLWLQFDHVVPHSHGGRSSIENVVISCALCNYGKDKYTLRQLNVADPRLIPPVASPWDGLERFREVNTSQPAKRTKRVGGDSDENAHSPPPNAAGLTRSQDVGTFFFPAAKLSGGYLYTPVIAGKERWFKLDQESTCVPATRQGVAGYLLSCERAGLLRRGIDPDSFIDTEHVGTLLEE